MKATRFFAITLAAAIVLTACSRTGRGDDANATNDSMRQELNDSLATALAEKDSLVALMNEISDGMTEIKEMQDIISSGNMNAETADRKRELRNDIVAIQKAVSERQQRLNDLEKRLKQSTHYNEESRKSIESMKKQLAAQQATIKDLTEQLRKAHIQIVSLSGSVDSLTTANTQVTKEKELAVAETKRLSTEVEQLNTSVDNLNVCYYVVGSKDELKRHKIISSGFLRKTKIMEGDYEKSYFTKADRRTLTEIPLHCKKAELLSKHPQGSYSLVKNGNILMLHITNPDAFWEQSNYLIVKTN